MNTFINNFALYCFCYFLWNDFYQGYIAYEQLRLIFLMHAVCCTIFFCLFNQEIQSHEKCRESNSSPLHQRSIVVEWNSSNGSRWNWQFLCIWIFPSITCSTLRNNNSCRFVAPNILITTQSQQQQKKKLTCPQLLVKSLLLTLRRASSRVSEFSKFHF